MFFVVKNRLIVYLFNRKERKGLRKVRKGISFVSFVVKIKLTATVLISESEAIYFDVEWSLYK